MSDRLTDEQITEGLRLAGEATPGPWSVSDYADYIFGPQDAMVADGCPHCAGFRIRGYGGKLPQEQNAKWIAHAGTHYAAVLAEVQALRKVLCEQAGNEAAGAAAQSQRLCDHERQMSEWEGER